MIFAHLGGLQLLCVTEKGLLAELDGLVNLLEVGVDLEGDLLILLLQGFHLGLYLGL